MLPSTQRGITVYRNLSITVISVVIHKVIPPPHRYIASYYINLPDIIIPFVVTLAAFII